MNLFGFDIFLIILHAIIAIAIAVPMGKVHELIHLYTAKRLGYKIINFSLWKNETEVDIRADDPNVKKIGYAPYLVMVPLSIVLIVLGWQFQILGVLIGGAGSLLIHLITLPLEGRESKDDR